MEKFNQINTKFFNPLTDKNPVHTQRTLEENNTILTNTNSSENKLGNIQTVLVNFNNLSAQQAEGIAAGLTLNEVIGLKTSLEIEASICLKNKGVCVKELKIGSRSKPEYLQALLFLVNKKICLLKQYFMNLEIWTLNS